METKLVKLIYKSSLICIFSLITFHQKSIVAAKEPIIRVLIKKENQLRVRSDSSIPLIIKGNQFFNKKIKGLTIKTIGKKKIFFFDKNKEKFYDLNSNSLLIRSFDKKGIWVGNKRYAGIINIILKDNQIHVINKLGVENYLSSVVGSEMPPKWPLEALKAQAIASRTYALKKKGNTIFDLDSTQNNQVYSGLESRTTKTQMAVRATRSLVITHNNKLINALFHSSSAGQTENSEEVWSNKYAYLRSVKDFDKDNPKLSWKKSFSKNNLKNLFPIIGGIENIKVLEKTSTGRVKLLEITGVKDAKTISGKDFRRKLKLNSTLFNYSFVRSNSNVEINSNNNLNNSSQAYFLISGKGSGHAVGMSQWGAKYMASKGLKARNILEYFYKGIQIKPYKKNFK